MFGKKKSDKSSSEKKEPLPPQSVATGAYPSQATAPSQPPPYNPAPPAGPPPAYNPQQPYCPPGAPMYGAPGAPMYGAPCGPPGAQPYPTAGQAAPNTTYVVQGGFDAGARFDGASKPNLPPPPPGCAPNMAQLAAFAGQNVVVTQRPDNYWAGGSDGGYTMF